MRDIETIDAALQILARAFSSVHEMGIETDTADIDQLLDERHRRTTELPRTEMVELRGLELLRFLGQAYEEP